MNISLQSKRVLAMCLLVVCSSLVASYLVMSVRSTNVEPRKVPRITLASSERVSENVPSSALASAPLVDDKQIYLLRRDTANVAVYDSERKQSKKDLASFSPSTKAVAVGTEGRVYVASESEVRVFEPTGRQVAKFKIPSPSSLAVTANGRVVVSSSDLEKLLYVYDQRGFQMRAIGEQKKFDNQNPAQNRFLNRGKVLVSPSGDFYHVSTYAPAPIVRKFSSQGNLLAEFPIEGAAVERQLGHARAFLNIKKAEMVGGVRVINSAAIDPLTGHLWVSTNGSSVNHMVTSGSGVLYEYDSNGVKLAEYALVLKAPLAEAGALTDVRDLTVNGRWIHVLTSQGKVYRFNTGDRVAQDSIEPAPSKGSLASLVQNFWSLAHANKPEVCEQEQPYTCVANCPTNSPTQTVNCGTELRARMAESDRIVNGSCTQGPNGCEGTINTCNTSTGVQATISLTLTCASPTPTPQAQATPTPGYCLGIADWLTFPSSGCITGLFFQGPCTRSTAFRSRCSEYIDETCSCESGGGMSPIVIDVDGGGFDLTDAGGGVAFNMLNDGVPLQLSWTAPSSTNAFLVLDRNDNGTVDNGEELFGDSTPQPASSTPNGFLALAEFDKSIQGGNGNGKIDVHDAVFSQLRLWQDVNHNGVSEPSELRPLAGLLSAIDLNYKVSKQTDRNGNEFRYRAKVYDTHGTHAGRWAWDVFLTYQ